jgi:hypothetical protein
LFATAAQNIAAFVSAIKIACILDILFTRNRRYKDTSDTEARDETSVVPFKLNLDFVANCQLRYYSERRSSVRQGKCCFDTVWRAFQGPKVARGGLIHLVLVVGKHGTLPAAHHRMPGASALRRVSKAKQDD